MGGVATGSRRLGRPPHMAEGVVMGVEVAGTTLTPVALMGTNHHGDLMVEYLCQCGRHVIVRVNGVFDGGPQKTCGLRCPLSRRGKWGGHHSTAWKGAAGESTVAADLEWRGLRVYLGHGSQTHPDMVVGLPDGRLFGVEARTATRCRGYVVRAKRHTDRTDYYAWVTSEDRSVTYEATRTDLPRFWETITTQEETSPNADSEKGLLS